MQRCTYRILGFAKSGLDPEGVPFVVLLRFDDLREQFFKLFYLAEWHEMVGTGVEAEISYVEDLLYDFRQYARKSFTESNEALETAANLSNGPMRTELVGFGVIPSLTEIHPELHGDADTYTCSDTSFAALVKAVVESSDKGQNAASLHLGVSSNITK